MDPGGGIALPLYFFLSAFFFVHSFSLDIIDIKIISRIKSVVLPYFFWNLFFIEAYAFFHWLQKHTGFILTRETYFPGGLKEILRFVWLGYRDPPLWYLQVLMEFILMTPVLFCIFRKYKKVSFLICVIFLIINLWFYNDIKYASVVYWMPVYGAGIWFGIYCPESVLNDSDKRKYIYGVFCALVLVLFICMLCFLSNTDYFRYCGWMLMPAILLGISYILPQRELYDGMYDAEFLIFCVHYPLIQLLDALADNFFMPVSVMQVCLKWILTVLLTLLISHLTHWGIRRFVKPVYSLLYGKY